MSAAGGRTEGERASAGRRPSHARTPPARTAAPPESHPLADAQLACLRAIDLSHETGIEHAVRLYACRSWGLLTVLTGPLWAVCRDRWRCSCGKRCRAKGPVRRIWLDYVARHEEHLSELARWN